MNGKCDMAEWKQYMPSGDCAGDLLLYNDNAGGTIRCERHARMVQAWIDTPKAVRPIHDFLLALTPIHLGAFFERMKSVSLKSWIPYVPKHEKVKP